MPSDAMRHTACEVPLLRQDTRRRVAVGLAVAAIFALALALRQACALDGSTDIPSTKGSL